MPEYLANGLPVATGNLYTPETTLGPSPGVKQITFSVLGANPCLVQYWRYTDSSRGTFVLEQIEEVYVGQSIGVVLTNCAGVRFRNATTNQSTTVIGKLVFDDDIVSSGGAISGAAINSGGGITPPPAAAVNVQKNGVLVGTEPTLDFVDASGIVWQVVDDSGNTRVRIEAAPSGVTGIVSSAGAVVAGTGFTVVRNFAGNYTVTYASVFLAQPVVVVDLIGAGPGGHVLQASSAAGFTVSFFNTSGGSLDIGFDFVSLIVR